VKVLIAEDDHDIRAVLELAVASLGYEVRSARDGSQAWLLYQDEGADVIISDWLMPGLEGTELCRLVRSAADMPYVYFVILTALDSEEHMLQGMQAGADDYLNKPFTIGALQARLVAAEPSPPCIARSTSGTPSAPRRWRGGRHSSGWPGASPPSPTPTPSCVT